MHKNFLTRVSPQYGVTRGRPPSPQWRHWSAVSKFCFQIVVAGRKISSGTSYIRWWHTLTDRAIATWRMSRRTGRVSANELSASPVRRHQRPTMLASCAAESVVHARSAHLRNAGSHLHEQAVVRQSSSCFWGRPAENFGANRDVAGARRASLHLRCLTGLRVTWCGGGSAASLNKTKLFIKKHEPRMVAPVSFQIFREVFFTLPNDAAPTGGNQYKVLLNISRIDVRRRFLLNELLLSGIVCHLQSLILEVCHSSRELSIMLMRIYLHDTDVLCGFIICIVDLFIFSLCISVVIVILLMWCVSGLRPFITNNKIK